MMIKKLLKSTFRMMGLDIRRLPSKFGSDKADMDPLIHNSAENMNRRFGSERFLKEEYLSIERLDLYEKLAELVHCSSGDAVLDLGCGPGHLLRIIAERNKIKAHAYDQAEKVRDYVEKTVHGVEFKAGDIYSTDYADGAFQRILCTEVFEHLKYPGRALNEVLRILAPGGQLLLTVPDGRLDSYRGHIHFWSPESFELFLEGHEHSTIQVIRGKVLATMLTH